MHAGPRDPPETTLVPDIPTHYRKEMISVLDRLATEFRDVQRSAESVAEPFACLLPQRICKISDDDVANLCRKFSKDLSNPDALRTEIDLMSQDIQHVPPE